jgi:hypothetical protein
MANRKAIKYETTSTVKARNGFQSTQEKPRFVFDHLLIPHPPFLFDRVSDPVEQSIFTLSGDYIWAHKEAYIDQVIFLNKKV